MIFANRKAALLFVALMLVSSVNLVGTREKGGALTQVRHRVADQRDAFEQAVGELGEPDETSAERNRTGFSDEEQLFDYADGTDPSPPEADEDGSDAGEPEVALVEPDEPDYEDEE
jgi:hypothetical protein